MIVRKQSTATYPIQFLMVDSSDHVSAKTGLTPTVTISKNGGAYGAAAGAVSEVGNGVYSLAGNVGDRDTLGELMIHVSAVGADPVDLKVLVAQFDPVADIASILADTGTDGVVLPTMPADWVTAAGVKADAVTKIQSGLATTSHVQEVEDKIDTIDGVADAVKAKTDNLPALPAATGDAMTLTAGERTAIANEVEAQIIDDTDAERVLTAITDKIASVNPSLDDLTLAGIASAVRTELATELARIDAAISSRLSTAGYTAPANADVAAIKAKTDNLPIDPASQAAVESAINEISIPGIPTAEEIRQEIDANSTKLSDIGTVTDKLNTALETDGLVYRFTENALENAPTGGDIEALVEAMENLPGEIYDELSSIPAISIGLPRAGEFAAQAGDSVSFIVTGLGNLSGAKKIYMSIKTRKSDTDAQSVIALERTAGLLRINGAAATALNGSLTVVNEALGNVEVELAAVESIKIAEGTYFIDVKVIEANDDAVTRMQGEITFYYDITKAVS